MASKAKIISRTKILINPTQEEFSKTLDTLAGYNFSRDYAESARKAFHQWLNGTLHASNGIEVHWRWENGDVRVRLVKRED